MILLQRILAGEELSRTEMEAFIGDLMDGRVPDAQDRKSVV